MKKFSFLAMAALGLLFAACADKDVAADNGGTDVLKEKGVGFLKVNINLPSDAPTTTRAWAEDNDHLKDGKESEWKVNSALLVIFTGNSESEATVAQVNTLTGSWNPVTVNNPNQVTVNHEEVVQLTASTASKLYALVVINGTGVIEAEGNTLKVMNNGAWEEASTIGDLQAAIAQASATTGANTFVNATDGSIFMTNAVLSNVRGGKNDPTANPAKHILATIDSKYIYETEAAAQAGTPATDIYVERGVAKVTINNTNLKVSGLKTSANAAPTMTFNGWCLDNTNTQSYVVRNVPAYADGVFSWNYFNVSCTSGNDKYRFVGNTPVDAEYSTATAGYRTYWAVDPNYNTTTVPLFNPTLDAALTTAVGDNNPLYCYENTFDVDHQSYQYTTAVIVKVTLGGGDDFYTVGADRKTLYSVDDVEIMIANVLMGLSDFKTWFEEKVGNTTTNLTKDDIAITWNPDAAGVVEVEDVTVTIAAGAYPGSYKVSEIASVGSTLLSTVNAQVANIKRYVGGATYYAIRIKHFGDDLTPWANIAVGGVLPAESTIDKIYPGTGDVRNAAYLGRYGVVRNNWYDLELNDIVKIGAATPGELRTTDHPDDDLEDSFIKARINILSWAKRPQSWNLK
ncbi:MAG: Mfa1 fimbrilin C-terminal domain-containing protein [Prevotella sp.]|nr:Mfa1 fimbrilin C-terminal domain-containing protein [Prevotella sp.]